MKNSFRPSMQREMKKHWGGAVAKPFEVRKETRWAATISSKSSKKKRGGKKRIDLLGQCGDENLSGFAISA